jgi:hypothetical protein
MNCNIVGQCVKMCDINKIVEKMFTHNYLSTLVCFIYILTIFFLKKRIKMYIEVP